MRPDETSALVACRTPLHLRCLLRHLPVESRVINPQAISQACQSEYPMEMNQTSNRIHPLMAGAAVSVILVSLAGIAAITGVLPNSHTTAAPTTEAQTAQVTAQVPAAAPIAAPAQPVVNPVAAAPAVRDERATHKTAVHRPPVQHAQAQSGQQVSQAPAYQQPAPADQPSAPVYEQSAPAPAPVAQNSPIGIGVGAVVGGLLGNQVGGGKGKTLATIAGAVGGGYLGNEIAKRTP